MSPCAQILLTGFVGISAVILAQAWTSRRELISRRDKARLDIYIDVIELIVSYEEFRAQVNAENSRLPLQVQSATINVSHRLRLIGSAEVRAEFKKYIQARSKDVDRISGVDRQGWLEHKSVEDLTVSLVDTMRADFGVVLNSSGQNLFRRCVLFKWRFH